jgi:hypothetical protein
MPARKTTTRHPWIGAVTLRLDEKQASHGARLGSVMILEDTADDEPAAPVEASVLEVYCEHCARPWDDAVDVACAEAPPAPGGRPRTAHSWLGACEIRLETEQAETGGQSGFVVLQTGREVLEAPVLDVYCRECRRRWVAVAAAECEAAESNEHLRGGPIGVRASRKHRYHECEKLGCLFTTARGA